MNDSTSTTFHDMDLEAYLDGELDPGRAGDLAASLRAEPALRARLCSIRAADAAVLASTLIPAAHPAPIPSVLAHWRLPLALAATTLLAIGLTAWLALRPGGDRSGADGLTGRAHTADAPLPAPAATESDGSPAAESFIRVSLGTVQPRLGTLHSAEAGPPTPIALWGRRTPAAAEAQSPDDAEFPVDPAERYLTQAGGVRSPEEGLALLEQLSPAERVGACAAWVRVPRTRPIAFGELARLRLDPVAGPLAQAAIRDLARQPSLAPWLRMHALLPDPIESGPVR